MLFAGDPRALPAFPAIFPSLLPEVLSPSGLGPQPLVLFTLSVPGLWKVLEWYQIRYANQAADFKFKQYTQKSLKV